MRIEVVESTEEEREAAASDVFGVEEEEELDGD